MLLSAHPGGPGSEAEPAPFSLAHATAAHGLTDLQKRILRAALRCEDRRHSIWVLRAEEGVEGEIKVGSERVPGDGAVRAVDRLCLAGYLTLTEESSFGLTAAGRRIARSLVGPEAPRYGAS